MTTELYIHKYDLSIYKNDLEFGDDLPAVIGYLRVSSDMQVDEGHSLDAQLVFIREACQRRFADGFHLIFVADPGLSGTLFYRRKGRNERLYRPGLTVVTELIEQGIAQFLCCYKCDRLCRDLDIWLELEKNYLKKYGVEFFAAAEPVSNNDAASKFIADILMANADYAGATIREISQHGIDKRRADGYFFGQVCFGWRWQDERLVPPDHYVDIEPHPEEATIVNQMIDWYLSGRSKGWIAHQLEDRGIRAPRGNSNWDKSSIHKILVNPRHCGLIKDKDGKWVRGAHYKKRIIDEGTHQAIIDRDYRLDLSPTRACTEDALLRGIGRCGICGAGIRLISRTRGGAAYRCHGNSAHRPHASFGVSVRALDSWVTDRIGELVVSREFTGLVADEVETSLAAQEVDPVATEAKCLADLDAIDSERNHMTEMYKCGDLSTDEYDAILAEQECDRSAIAKRLADLKRQTHAGMGTQARLQNALRLLSQFPSVWAELDRDEKRGLVYNLIESLILQPKEGGIDVSLKLVVSSQVHYIGFARSVRPPCGKKEISLAVLRFANHLISGHSVQDAASECQIASSTAKTYISELIRFTESQNLKEALELAAPRIAALKDKLSKPIHRRPRLYDELTELEKQILDLLSQGYISYEVAQLLQIAPGAMNGRRIGIRVKLGAANIGEAIEIAVARELIPLRARRIRPPIGVNMQVLQLVLSGKTRKRVAEILEMKIENVHSRLEYMARKYGLKRTKDLVDLAAREGWVNNNEL